MSRNPTGAQTFSSSSSPYGRPLIVNKTPKVVRFTSVLVLTRLPSSWKEKKERQLANIAASSSPGPHILRACRHTQSMLRHTTQTKDHPLVYLLLWGFFSFFLFFYFEKEERKKKQKNSIAHKASDVPPPRTCSSSSGAPYNSVPGAHFQPI